MNEAFLHYIWQYQNFSIPTLSTTDGEALIIHRTGYHNKDAGPDFQEAQLEIGGIKWSGAVEIHVYGQDWFHHKHEEDPNYENVILHVIWDEYVALTYADGRKVPTLILKGIVEESLIEKYLQLINNLELVPCASNLGKVNPLVIAQMKEVSLVERLHQKSEKAEVFFEQAAGDWEATTYYMLMSAFGFKVNQYAFERLSELLPIQMIHKYDQQAQMVEALFFGYAGLLDNDSSQLVQEEVSRNWKFLRHKHKIADVLPPHLWKFLRLRPANFPTVRIAQASDVVQRVKKLFQRFVLEADYQALFKLLKGEEERDVSSKLSLGDFSVRTLILNVSPAMLTLYARKTDNYAYLDKALYLLEKIAYEDNKVTRMYKKIGFSLQTAYDSQALLQLYSSYCLPKQCLNCKIGLSILKCN